MKWCIPLHCCEPSIVASIKRRRWICAVAGLEVVGPSKRLWVGVTPGIFFGLGAMLLPLMAYFLRHWQHLQIACAVCTLPYLAYWWSVSAVSWLVSWCLMRSQGEDHIVVVVDIVATTIFAVSVFCQCWKSILTALSAKFCYLPSISFIVGNDYGKMWRWI